MALLCVTPVAFAIANSNSVFPLTSRLAVDGTTGSNSYYAGDGMVPLWGNRNQIFFTDIQGKYGSHAAWLLSVGLGGRKIFDEKRILGAYLFEDFNRTPFGSQFDDLSPGIEFMTVHWDGHLNGYFPIGQKTKLKGIFTGEQLGINNSYFFTQHSEYENLFDSLESVGNGFDFELGHTFYFLNRTRVFLGGYHFGIPQPSNVNNSNVNATNVNGVEGGVEIPLKYKRASIEFRDSYDNITHNNFLVTLRYTFGGPNKNGTPNIHQRMLDRIPRHLANLANGDGLPSHEQAVDTGRTKLVKTNLWFFNPNAGTVNNGPITYQSCTYEHPCFGLSQADITGINAISPDANFYLRPGTYNNLPGGGFSFYNGQNVYGRSWDYFSSAPDNNRPTLNDTLFLNGNNRISHININGNTQVNGALTGIEIDPNAAGTVKLKDTNVTVADDNGGSVVGIDQESNNVTLDVKNSSILVTGSAPDAETFTSIVGILNNGGELNITNSSISAILTSGFSVYIAGLEALGGDVTIANSLISGAALGSGFDISMYGVDNEGANVAINQSTLSAAGGIGSFISSTTGINNGAGTLSVTDSQIEASADLGSVTGLNNNATATLNDSTISVSSTGTPIINTGTLVCIQNGVKVPC